MESSNANNNGGSSTERAETRGTSEERRRSKAVSAVSSVSPPPTNAPAQAPPPIPQSRPVPAPAPAVAQEKEPHPHSHPHPHPLPRAPHHPHQSYLPNPYPYGSLPYTGHTARAMPLVVPYDKTWMQVKLTLTAFSVLFCIILLTLACIIAATSLDPITLSSVTGYWAIPFTLIVLFWNFAEFLTVCACGTRGVPEGAASTGVRVRRGIHPGAHVGVDLIIWLIGIICILAATVVLTEADDQRQDCQRRTAGNRDYSYYSCNKAILQFLNSSNYIPMLRAITAFVCLITAIHFVIFCRACVETHERNRQRRVLIVPQPMYYGGAPQGMMPYPGPNTYQMLPPQTPVARGNHGGPVVNEKKTLPQLPQPQQGNYSDLAGFYAPPAQTRTRDFAQNPVVPQDRVASSPTEASASTSQQPTVASSSRQPQEVDLRRI